jgi:hypothetical protein
MPEASSITGGCACGAIRYALRSRPFDTGWCHCKLCRRTSGAPAVVFTTIPAGDFELVQGGDALRVWRSTSFGERTFCPICGSLLSIRIDYQPDTIDITAATLDQPELVTPEFHIFWQDAIAWAAFDDGLPRYPRLRPDTRGLPPGQTSPPDAP